MEHAVSEWAYHSIGQQLISSFHRHQCGENVKQIVGSSLRCPSKLTFSHVLSFVPPLQRLAGFKGPKLMFTLTTFAWNFVFLIRIIEQQKQEWRMKKKQQHRFIWFVYGRALYLDRNLFIQWNWNHSLHALECESGKNDVIFCLFWANKQLKRNKACKWK